MSPIAIALIGLANLSAFLWAVIARRSYVRTALVAATLAMLAYAGVRGPGLADLAAMWGAALAAAAVGAWLGKLVHAYWRSA